MLGVSVNTAAVIVGTILGLLLKKVMKESVTKVIMQAMGVAVLVVGILDVVKTYNVLLLVISLALGGLVGAILHIQDGIERFGGFLEKKLSKNPDGTLGKAFVNSTLIFCVGAMVIYGGIQSGLGSPTTLYIKSILDGVMAMMLATTLGWGVMLSAIPLFIIQGAFALCASAIQPFVIPAFMSQLSGLGGTLVVCIGLNILEVTKIRVADLIPSILGCLFVFIL